MRKRNAEVGIVSTAAVPEWKMRAFAIIAGEIDRLSEAEMKKPKAKN